MYRIERSECGKYKNMKECSSVGSMIYRLGGEGITHVRVVVAVLLKEAPQDHLANRLHVLNVTLQSGHV